MKVLGDNMRVISSDVSTHDSDERYQVAHVPDLDQWVLQIKYVKKKDEGLYACLVSHPYGFRNQRRI